MVAERSRLGDRFAFDLHAAGVGPEPPWQPLRVLMDDPDVLPARIAATRQALADAGGRPLVAIDEQAAASLTHLGVVGRIMAPVLALAALHGGQTSTLPAELWWQPGHLGAFPLSLSAPRAGPPAGAVAALVDDALVPLAEAISRAGQVREGVLWSNVASVAATTTDQLRSAEPSRAGAAAHVAQVLFAHPRLVAATEAFGAPFRRATCCLLPRLGARTPRCPDCPAASDCLVTPAP